MPAARWLEATAIPALTRLLPAATLVLVPIAGQRMGRLESFWRRSPCGLVALMASGFAFGLDGATFVGFLAIEIDAIVAIMFAGCFVIWAGTIRTYSATYSRPRLWESIWRFAPRWVPTVLALSFVNFFVELMLVPAGPPDGNAARTHAYNLHASRAEAMAWVCIYGSAAAYCGYARWRRCDKVQN